MDVTSAGLALWAISSSARYTLKSHRKLSEYAPDDPRRPVGMARRRTKALLTFILCIIFLGALHHLFYISPYVQITLRYLVLVGIICVMRRNERDLGGVMLKPVPAPMPHDLVFPPKE